MKNQIKLVIIKVLILICLISLLSACDMENVDNKSDSTITNVEANEATLKRSYIFLEMVETDSGITGANIEYWKQFMKNELNINAEYSLGQSLNHSVKWIHNVINENLQTAWYFDSFKDKTLCSNMESATVIDISEFFDTSKYAPHIVDYLTINNGIYFLPTYIGEEYMCRTYNKRVLEELSLPVPISTTEFYKLAEAVKRKYVGESGKNTYIASYNIYSVVYDLYDIFLAFGCFMNFDVAQPIIARNPNTGEISFISESENFIAAIEYIQMLTEEGLLYRNERGIIPDDIEIISLVEDNNSITFDNETYGLYLKGINSTNVVYCKYDLSGFCFPGTVARAEVKEFIDIIENEVKINNLAKKFLTYGIEDENYSISDSTIFLNRDCTEIYPLFRFNIDDIISVKITSNIENDELRLSKSERLKEIANNLDNDLIYYADYRIKHNLLNGADRSKYMRIYQEFCFAWARVFSGNINAHDGYLIYKKNIEEWYRDDILDIFTVNN